MATKYGELFSDEYQKSLKEQFCYADTDPDYGDRLFFENSGGSLRLRAAVEAKAGLEEYPDCPERVRGILWGKRVSSYNHRRPVPSREYGLVRDRKSVV